MIYLDSNVIIRLFEADAAACATLRSRLQNRGTLVTSELSRLECRSRPLRLNDSPLLTLYDDFFDSSDVRIFDLDRAVIDKATELRATTTLRTPDALHLATAIIHNASAFCTGDLHFKNIHLIPVEIL